MDDQLRQRALANEVLGVNEGRPVPVVTNTTIPPGITDPSLCASLSANNERSATVSGSPAAGRCGQEGVSSRVSPPLSCPARAPL